MTSETPKPMDAYECWLLRRVAEAWLGGQGLNGVL